MNKRELNALRAKTEARLAEIEREEAKMVADMHDGGLSLDAIEAMTDTFNRLADEAYDLERELRLAESSYTLRGVPQATRDLVAQNID